MRNVERFLVLTNLAGSVMAGARHETTWFLLPLAAFSLYVALENRALRRRIGPRAWPSEGYARFTFNTNLYFAFRNLLLGGLAFAVASTAAELVGL